VELILDASGSMFAKLADGRSRISAAKDVLLSLIGALPEDPDLNVGLRVYGAEKTAGEADACEDSRLLVPMNGLARADLLSAVRSVNARGATPIAISLTKAVADFPAGGGRKVIVLVTDGAESCRGDLKAAAEALKAQGMGIELRVISIDLSERAAASFAGLGTFENTTSATALLAALGRAVPVAAAPATLPVTVKLTRGGQPAAQGPTVRLESAVGDQTYPLTRGENGDFTARVPGGAYTVKIQDPLSNPPTLEFPGATVAAGAQNAYSNDLAPPAAVSLTVAGAGPAGGAVTVNVVGAPPQAAQARHYVALALEGGATGDYLAYAYVPAGNANPSLSLRTPEVPGRLEARYYVDQPGGSTRLLGRSAIFETTRPQASVTAPATVQAGARLEASVTGPNNSDDYIYVRKEGQTSGFVAYARPGADGKVTFNAPLEVGSYVLVYMLRDREAIATSAPVAVKAAAATVTVPASVEAGARFEVGFTGPNNRGDYLYLRKEGQTSSYVTYASTTEGGKVALKAPLEPGRYVVMYMLGDKQAIATSSPFTVAAATASVTVPASVKAGEAFVVTFKGPNNPGDYLLLRKAGATSGYVTYASMTASGEVRLVAPREPDEYEVVYVLGDKLVISTPARLVVR